MMQDLEQTGALARFHDVITRMVPLAEGECRARTSGVNCGLHVMLDISPDEPPNAYQLLDRNDRPVIVFTASLLQDVRNADELALVLGHEVAHHILGHVSHSRDMIREGALLSGMQAAVHGASTEERHAAEMRGALRSMLRYSKQFEFQADELGTVISHRAGFDPVRGAEYFVRMKSPRNRFLVTHPPNRARREAVRRLAGRLE